MSDMLDLTTIILTYNEALHIRRCLENVRQFSREIFIIDCFSSDKTVEIAREMGSQVLQHTWPGNQAEQFNWALENCGIKTSWILRLDADEYLSDALIGELKEKLSSVPENVAGIEFPLRRYFLGKYIKSMDGIKLLRLFRTGQGRSEVRNMDEHIAVDGDIILFQNWFADDNLNDLTWWTQKHLGYAIREAADLLDMEYTPEKDSGLTGQALRKRQLKEKYCHQPLFLRALVYFFYRYFIKGGFRCGKEGFLWDFLQGLWYRMFVDAKIFEIKKACGSDPEKIREYLQEQYHISLK